MRNVMDEYQLSVDKSNFTDWNAFDSKEDAQAYVAKKREEGLMYSDISKIGDRYYVAYSRVGELSALALEEASKHFMMNVTLTGGYMIGENWRDCH